MAPIGHVLTCTAKRHAVIVHLCPRPQFPRAADVWRQRSLACSFGRIFFGPDWLGMQVRDMPGIMTTLCQDTAMLAFGHNDYTTDNAWFVRDRQTRQLEFGVFDWQQSCVNNVGQEWAWNLHFLEPEVSPRTPMSLPPRRLSASQRAGCKSSVRHRHCSILGPHRCSRSPVGSSTDPRVGEIYVHIYI